MSVPLPFLAGLSVGEWRMSQKLRVLFLNCLHRRYVPVLDGRVQVEHRVLLLSWKQFNFLVPPA